MLVILQLDVMLFAMTAMLMFRSSYIALYVHEYFVHEVGQMMLVTGFCSDYLNGN